MSNELILAIQEMIFLVEEVFMQTLQPIQPTNSMVL